jgi:hypothetical protein
MIVKKLQNQGVLFESPFDQELDPGNRWIKYSRIIPWDQLSDFICRGWTQKWEQQLRMRVLFWEH